jgi:hypothetical protein
MEGRGRARRSIRERKKNLEEKMRDREKRDGRKDERQKKDGKEGVVCKIDMQHNESMCKNNSYKLKWNFNYQDYNSIQINI